MLARSNTELSELDRPGSHPRCGRRLGGGAPEAAAHVAAAAKGEADAGPPLLQVTDEAEHATTACSCCRWPLPPGLPPRPLFGCSGGRSSKELLLLLGAVGGDSPPVAPANALGALARQLLLALPASEGGADWRSTCARSTCSSQSQAGRQAARAGAGEG